MGSSNKRVNWIPVFTCVNTTKLMVYKQRLLSLSLFSLISLSSINFGHLCACVCVCVRNSLHIIVMNSLRYGEFIINHKRCRHLAGYKATRVRCAVVKTNL